MGKCEAPWELEWIGKKKKTYTSNHCQVSSSQIYNLILELQKLELSTLIGWKGVLLKTSS